MGIRTTVVGSWWIHAEDEGELAQHFAGKLTDTESEALLTRAAAKAIKEQRDLGLDDWSGGEYHTDNFICHVHRHLTGLEVIKQAESTISDYDDITAAKVVGTIDAPKGLGYLDAYKREKDLPGGVRKAAVPGPFDVPIAALFSDMENVKKQIPGLVALVNRELRGIADAGCPVVQLDAAVEAQFVNAGFMTPQQAADAIGACFEGVKAKKALHVCNGTLRGRPSIGSLRCAPWVEILQRLDGIVDIAIVEVKYFSQYQEREAFKALPKNMTLSAGIVDEACYWVEPVKKIRERIADWARVVGEERLWVSTSCGFNRHPSRSIPVLRQKIENMVAAARSV
jgi:methionine synthase II (cobalamin-independent)